MIEPPSGGVPKKAPRWDLTGTEACGGGKVFWWMLLVVGIVARKTKNFLRTRNDLTTKKYTSVVVRVCHSRSRFLSCMYIHENFMTESR